MNINIEMIHVFEYNGYILKLRWHPKFKEKSFGYKKEPTEGMWSIHTKERYRASEMVYSKSNNHFVFEDTPSERKDLEDTRFTIKESLEIIDKLRGEKR
jgi:hypothetical protein